MKKIFMLYFTLYKKDNYLNFAGRVSRKRFWLTFIPIIILYAPIIWVITIMMLIIKKEMIFRLTLVCFAYMMILILPMIPLIVRRLHDRNKSGIIIPIYLIIFLLSSLMEFTNFPCSQIVMMIIVLIGIIIEIYIFVNLCLPSLNQNNRYGNVVLDDCSICEKVTNRFLPIKVAIGVAYYITIIIFVLKLILIK